MSEKTREVPQLADATYAHTLVIESTHIHRQFHHTNFEYTLYLEVFRPLWFFQTLPLKMSVFKDESLIPAQHSFTYFPDKSPRSVADPITKEYQILYVF